VRVTWSCEVPTQALLSSCLSSNIRPDSPAPAKLLIKPTMANEEREKAEKVAAAKKRVCV
jgi:hypothetical protein